ncbi:MAG TPA: efflux RND transporter periplasmic adaptor subunit [Gemmatimonadaceae bacterium]|nr:efflux RND transporter periplasmic adaptor subunit [Gemmatimonadaceae bacterium]
MSSIQPPPDLSRLRIDRDAPTPAVRRAVRRNAILAVSTLGLILIAAAGAKLFADRPVPVETTLVVASGDAAGGGGGARVTANGYVVARTRAAVSSKVPGRLARLDVAEGSHVTRGSLIARLENADYEAQVAQAQANLASARARLIETEADQRQLDREAKRLADIRTRNAQLIAEQEVEAAQSRAEAAAARARSAAAAVAAADAAVRFARVNLANTEIRAPFTGTVLRKEAEVGEVVAPSVGGGLTRGAVVTMADLTTLEVDVDVNEAYIARITTAQPTRITLDAYPDTAFRGEVRQVVPTADRQRATVQVKVAILDRDPRILPEMGARVDFLEPEVTQAGASAPRAARAPRIRVPVGAVRQHQGRTVVWIVRDGRLAARDVEAGPESGGYREIRRGLSGGELLMTGGVESPADGLRVKVPTP